VTAPAWLSPERAVRRIKRSLRSFFLNGDNHHRNVLEYLEGAKCLDIQ
jgi:hypothetical protein